MSLALDAVESGGGGWRQRHAVGVQGAGDVHPDGIVEVGRHLNLVRPGAARPSQPKVGALAHNGGLDEGRGDHRDPHGGSTGPAIVVEQAYSECIGADVRNGGRAGEGAVAANVEPGRATEFGEEDGVARRADGVGCERGSIRRADGGEGLREGVTEEHRQYETEDEAIASGGGSIVTRAAVLGSAAERAVARLDDRGLWIRAIGPIEPDYRGQDAVGGDAEHRALAAPTALGSSAVEVAIGGLEQSGPGISAIVVGERIEGREGAVRCHAEDGAPTAVGATGAGGAIEKAVAGLDQGPDGISPVSIAERNQGGERSVGSHTEDGAIVIGAAEIGGAVENAIGRLHQRSHRVSAVVLSEGYQGSEDAIGGDTEDAAKVIGAALVSGAVEFRIRALNQAGGGIGAIVAPQERVEEGEAAGGSHLEHGAGRGVATLKSRAIEIPVPALHQSREWSRA